jgi:hypothetical protein
MMVRQCQADQSITQHVQSLLQQDAAPEVGAVALHADCTSKPHSLITHYQEEKLLT